MSDFVVSLLIGLVALIVLLGCATAYALAMQIGKEPTLLQNALFGLALTLVAGGARLAFWLLKKTISRKWPGAK